MRGSQSRSNHPQTSQQLDHQLGKYALAAAAAGVRILALGTPSEAEVVYTPAHQTIRPNTTIELDLNNDGIPDFVVKDIDSHSFFSTFGHMSAQPAASQNAVWGHTVSGRAYASALLPNALVGPNGQFLPGAGLMADTSFLGGARHKPGHPPASVSCTAPWANVMNRYLGFKFMISGEVHFGWARLSVVCPKDHIEVLGLLTGYAYETVPNRPVLTGREKGQEDSEIEPGSLGDLARGAR